jgi:hypothetical protein
MAMNTATFAKTVGLTLYEKPFKVEADKKVWDWDKAFTSGKMTRNQWQTYQYTGFGSAVLGGELEPVVFENAFELAAYTITAIKYVKGFIVSEELEDDSWQIKGLLGKWAKSLGRSQSYAREVSLASVFNNAFSSSFTGWDSVELCGSHTTTSGTTIDNDLGPSSLSFDTLWDMQKYFAYSIFDEAGLPVTDTPRLLQCHPALQDTVEKILTSPGEPDSGDRNANTLADKGITPLYNRLLSSQTAFFLHGAMMKEYLHFLQRIPVRVKWKDAFENIGRKCRTHQRFGYGFSDYRCIVGNPGA